MTRYLPRRHNRMRAGRAVPFVLCALAVFASCSPTEPEYPAAPNAGIVRLTNSSTHEIGVFRIRQAGTDRWGRNYLESDPLRVDYYIDLYVPVGGIDIRCESADRMLYWTFSSRAIEKNQTMEIELTD